METRITATELARRLSRILTRVQRDRERFVIDRDGEAITVLAHLITFRTKGYVVLTHNARGFARVPGLEVRTV